MIFITRDSKNPLSHSFPISAHVEKCNSIIIFRIGQIYDNKIIGIGRKLIIQNPIINQNHITDFTNAIIEEG